MIKRMFCMKPLLSILIISILSLSCWANVSKPTSSEDADSNRDNLIAVLYGRWEGTIEYKYHENTELKKTYTNDLSIEVTPTGISLFDKNEKGDWIKASPKFINSFKFLMEKNTLSGYFLNSGTDEDGLWVESQSIYITLKDENTVLFYAIRAVNNTGIVNSKPGTKWMRVSLGELKRQ